jgi:hypothetical protein
LLINQMQIQLAAAAARQTKHTVRRSSLEESSKLFVIDQCIADGGYFNYVFLRGWAGADAMALGENYLNLCTAKTHALPAAGGLERMVWLALSWVGAESRPKPCAPEPWVLIEVVLKRLTGSRIGRDICGFADYAAAADLGAPVWWQGNADCEISVQACMVMLIML